MRALTVMSGRQGSQLIQALLILGLLSTFGLVLLNLQSSDGRATSIAQANSKSENTIRAALVVSCERYLEGVTLRRNPATLLPRVNQDYGQIRNLQVLATIPPDAAIEEDKPIPIVVSTRIDGSEPVLARLTVFGSAGVDAGIETLTVKGCTASPFEVECKRQVRFTDHSITNYTSRGFGLYASFGKCLKNTYKQYKNAACIEPFVTSASIYNLCSEFVSQTTALDDYCAFQIAATLGRIPMAWAHTLGTCVMTGTTCPGDLCDGPL